MNIQDFIDALNASEKYPRLYALRDRPSMQNRKLGLAQVLAIRSSNMSYKQLAQFYNVSVSTIRDAKLGLNAYR